MVNLKKERENLERKSLGPFSNKDEISKSVQEIITIKHSMYVNWEKYAFYYKKADEGDRHSSYLIEIATNVLIFESRLSDWDGYEIEGYPIKNSSNKDLRFENKRDAQGFALALGISMKDLEDKIIYVE